jgi:hypothetical protein
MMKDISHKQRWSRGKVHRSSECGPNGCGERSHGRQGEEGDGTIVGGHERDKNMRIIVES